MVQVKSVASPVVRRTLLAGGVGVLPTDTMYGLVGSALMPATVERIYKLRGRDSKKPMIVLISSWSDLSRLGIRLTPTMRKKLDSLWPGSVSVVLPAPRASMTYLHRGGKTLAVRLPKSKSLIRLMSQVGPLVAPSANLQNREPATTASEAQAYFGKRIDFYVDGGTRGVVPSTLIRFERGKVVVLRQGKVKIKQ